MVDHLQAERQQKDQFFKYHEQSPIPSDKRDTFDGLSYYPPNEALDLTVKVTPFEQKEDIEIQTTTGDIRWYRRYGEFTFDVGGEQARLTIYQTPHGFFIPFVDANFGKETYGAGRYIDPEPLGNDLFHIDFNQAYNPYCAYNDDYSCPLTPFENRLNVAIRAGEKVPQGAWAQA